MARKHRYQLLCPIARALDVLGDRWSLLILRDLHAGPARYQQLQDGLGIATNLLSTRLGELQESQLIEKVENDGRSAYGLTELGRNTDRVLWELSRFGGRLDPDPDPREPGNLRTVALPLRMMLSAVEDRPDLSVQLLVDDEAFLIDLSTDAVEVSYNADSHAGDLQDAVPDLVVQTDYLGLLAVGEGRLSFEAFGADHLAVVEGEEHLGSFVDVMVRALT